MSSRPALRRVLWTKLSIAPDGAADSRTVRVTHRFHPLAGRTFEFLGHRQNWGEDRVYFVGDDGDLRSMPTAWTSEAPEDPFVVVAAGRSPFRLDKLVELAEILARLQT